MSDAGKHTEPNSHVSHYDEAQELLVHEFWRDATDAEIASHIGTTIPIIRRARAGLAETAELLPVFDRARKFDVIALKASEAVARIGWSGGLLSDFILAAIACFERHHTTNNEESGGIGVAIQNSDEGLRRGP